MLCAVLQPERYSVDKADLDTVFMGVRGDVEKLSLASYFCELTAQAAPVRRTRTAICACCSTPSTCSTRANAPAGF
ncbi:MAG: hypothetical protein ACLVL7_10850 [Anaerotruncus massiliensis (ex Togo et al. 2019)]